MNQKWIARVFFSCMLVIALAVNGSVVMASPTGQVTQEGKVITVRPTGKDDTANLQQAFARAMAAGPNSSVVLAAGNFHTSFIEVWDFDGTFKGAGQNSTLIDTFANQDCQKLVDHNRVPALFNFFRGNVRISDLGFHIKPVTPCKPFGFPSWGKGYAATWIFVLNISALPMAPETDCKTLQQERVSVLLTDVMVEGQKGAPQNGEVSEYWGSHPCGWYIQHKRFVEYGLSLHD